MKTLTGFCTHPENLAGAELKTNEGNCLTGNSETTLHSDCGVAAAHWVYEAHSDNSKKVEVKSMPFGKGGAGVIQTSLTGQADWVQTRQI